MESIGELKESISEKSKRIEELSKKEASARESISELHKQKVQLTEDMAEVETKTRAESQSLYQATEEIEILKKQIANAEESVKAKERENAIKELEAKQKDYWTVLEERLAFQMEQLAEGLEGFEEDRKDPAEIVKGFRMMAEGTHFGEPVMSIRNTERMYKKAIRELCERHIDGGKILPSMKQARLEILDRLLMSGVLLPHWT